MITLGCVAILVGYLLPIPILITVGVILVIIGIVLALLGLSGRAVGGHKHWY